MNPDANADEATTTQDLPDISVTDSTTDAILAALAGVIDPELGRDIVSLKMVHNVQVEDGVATITIALTIKGCPLRAQIQRDATARVLSVPAVTEVHFNWDVMTAEQKAETMDIVRKGEADSATPTAIAATTRVLAIASGKGGVGKSSVSTNLAVALALQGKRVGFIDADIWGFSIPRMLGVTGRLEANKVDGKARIEPHRSKFGEGCVDLVSMGLLVEDEQSALLWRGLMLNRAVQHFLEDVNWDQALDYMIIDMPPGTGDVALGLARMLPRAEMVIVTTPATGAQKVAARAVTMAQKSYVRVAGVIENMSYFINEDDKRYELFGSGGGAELAASAGVELLGQIPLEPAVSTGGDEGKPVATGEGPAAIEFRRIAELITSEIAPPLAMQSCSARLLDAAEAALAAALDDPAEESV